MFSRNIEQIATALGYPQTPAIPDGMAIGPIGWSLEQAQGTTGTYSGQIISFPGATGTGQTAGTAGRLNGLLDQFSAAANPEVVLRARRCKVLVSGAGIGQVTPEFLADLAGSLVIRHKPGQAVESRFPIALGIGTYESAVVTTASTTSAYSSTPDGWARLGAEGIEVDLSADTFELYASHSVALPASSTIRLDVWFDGILVGKRDWLDRQPASCAGQVGQEALKNVARTAHAVVLNLK